MNNTNSEYDAWVEENAEQLVQSFRNVAQTLYEAVKTVWDNIKEFLASIKHVEQPKIKWPVPVKITLPDQVLIRKPLMAVARSRC